MSEEPNETTEEGSAETPSPKAPGALRGVAIQHLRGLGHHTEPVVLIGKDGLGESIVVATKAALLRHELIKVKILKEAPVDRHEAAATLASESGSELVQVLGRTFLLYKRHPTKPRISLPRNRKDATAKAKGEEPKKKKNRRRARRG